MLIDWISMRYPVVTSDDVALRDSLRRSCNLVTEINEETGEVIAVWYKQSKDDESIRSDSHRVTLRVSPSTIYIKGSPARVMNGNNVFGSADLRQCANAMLRKVSETKEVILPHLDRWILTRVDVTQNYDCGSNVGTALESLAEAKDGHLKVKNQKETIYWNSGSDFWQAKAYAKGPHVVKEAKAGRQHLTDEQLELAQRLLRFEVQLCSKILRRQGLDFKTLTFPVMRELFMKLAAKIVPTSSQITNDVTLLDALRKAYGIRRARTLQATWALIQQGGEAYAAQMMSRPTFFRHKADLKAVGMSSADFSARKVVAFRPRQIVVRPVDAWHELKAA